MTQGTTSNPGASEERPLAKRKKILADPPEFDGTKRSEFQPWLSQVAVKLSVDLSGESETVRFWYVHGRLRKRALAQVDPWVRTNAEPMSTLRDGILKELVEQLKIAYADPKAIERATRRLQTMRQETRSFSTYLAEFERTLLDAEGGNWPEHVKKAFLSNGISWELHKAIVAAPVPDSYREYCSVLQSVSHNLEALRSRDTRTPPVYATVRTNALAADTEANTGEGMEWEPTQAIPVAAVQQRARWVAQEVINRRRKDNLCL
jgi:hypothetical protein